jgi:catecholate siderophore receptor
VGDRYANPGNTVTLPAYTTADAMAYYRARAFDVQLNVTNLFDRAYAAMGHGSSKHLILPGSPRAVQVTARYRF